MLHANINAISKVLRLTKQITQNVSEQVTTPCSEKKVHLVFECNFTTTNSIFLQLSVTVTK